MNIRFLLSPFIIIFGFAFCALAVSAEKPTPFSPQDKLFTMAFPGKPSTQEEPLQSSAGTAYKRITYVYQVKSSLLMAAVLYTAPYGETSEQERLDLLESTAASFTSEMPGLTINADSGVTDIRVGNYSGKQLKGVAEGMGFYCRVIITPHNLFMVQGLYQINNKTAEKSVVDSVNSFTPQ